MNFEEIYILHPAYILRTDEKRVILTSVEEHSIPIEAQRIPYADSAAFILHPFNAQLLAFFDGKHDLKDCIKNIASHFGLPTETVEKILTQYIENKASLANSYVQIPQNVLVRKSHLVRRETYTPEQFVLDGEPDLSYGRFYRPLRATIELTMKCYTDCIYCYADRSHCHNEELLSTERMKEVIRECRDIGIVDISINGGEVLMYENFKELFAELMNNGYNSLISTKKPIDKSTLVFLKQIGMTNIQLSLDSIRPETLTKMLHVGSSYIDKIRDTMNLLDEMEFNWSVHTILTRFNADVESEIEPLSEELMHYEHLSSFRIDPAGYSLYKSGENFNEIKVSLSDVKKVKDFMRGLAMRNKTKKIRMGDGDTIEKISSEEKRAAFDKRAICTGNQSSFVILPDGKITICEELYWHPKFIIGDLSNQSVLEIWQSPKAKQLFEISQKEFRLKSPCRSCKEFHECRSYSGVCWKTIMYAHGEENWDYPDLRCPLAIEPAREYYLK